MRIDSPQNRVIVETAKLKEKKYRKFYGKYLIEGAKMVEEAIGLGLAGQVFVAESCAGKFSFLPESAITVADAAFAKLCDTVTPQGVVAVAELPNTGMAGPSGDCLILDGIADCGNLGTLLRTAVAADFADVYLTPDCADAFAPKSVRSSMSGIFYARVHVGSREEILGAVKPECALIAADMGGENVFSYGGSGKFALVVGSEAHGVSREFYAASDEVLRLPMEKVESLNAAICAGIMMYVLKNTKRR